METPGLAKILGLTGTATVHVDLSEKGIALDAYVEKSTGSTILDRAALKVAKSIVYAPAMQSCEPVSGSYALQVEYVEP